ncbi:MAG: hypothetical protein JSW61_10260 [Candidatus Thorarchaeota archaeon]|nr:MAG: hypothetical protein JSW61_10260 [Candidatus Thorarchaeota archaeon]
MLRTAVAILIVSLVLLPTASATDFPTQSFTSDGVEVSVTISANTPWYSPFTQSVSVSLSVQPQAEGVTEVNVTEFILTVHRKDISGLGFSLISAESTSFTPAEEGESQVDIVSTVVISGGGLGEECYFGISVLGAYSNSSYSNAFTSTSDEDLIGPFAIRGGIGSPQVIVGIMVTVLFSVILIGGVWVARKNVARRKRRSLLDD